MLVNISIQGTSKPDFQFEVISLSTETIMDELMSSVLPIGEYVIEYENKWIGTFRIEMQRTVSRIAYPFDSPKPRKDS